jgi:signal peptidase I
MSFTPDVNDMSDTVADTAFDKASTNSQPPKEKKEHPLTEIIRFSLIALLIVFPIRMFVAQPFIVSGASMEETFQNGEYLIVDQISYRFEQPERGDVIVFRYPRDPSKFFIKRVIGLPGDKIAIEGAKVTITNGMHPQGAVLSEPYVASMQPNTFLEEELGEGEYFVMGDNRDQSSDSRMWGVLQEQNIVGRALLRLFPIDGAGVMPGMFNSNSALQDISS